jgi:hypothetical protein
MNFLMSQSTGIDYGEQDPAGSRIAAAHKDIRQSQGPQAELHGAADATW